MLFKNKKKNSTRLIEMCELKTDWFTLLFGIYFHYLSFQRKCFIAIQNIQTEH